MTGKAIRQSEMLQRVSEFGALHADRLAVTPASGAAVVALREAMAALKQHERTQARGRPDVCGRRKAGARQRLRARLRVLNRTARAMAMETPALAGRFRLPKSNGDGALIATALAFLDQAGDLTDMFVAYGLPVTFRDDLRAALDAFESAGREAEAARHASVAATRAIDVALAQAHRAAGRLDGIVPNLCGDNVAIMKQWQLRRRVPRARRRRRASIGSQLVQMRSFSVPADRQVLPADPRALIYSRVMGTIFEMVYATSGGGSICP